MNLQLNYDEVLTYVKQKYHVEPTIDFVDASTLRLAYKMNFFVPTISMYLHFVSVINNTIKLNYDSADFASILSLRLFIIYIKNNTNHSQIDIIEENKQVLIHLDAFTGLRQTLAVVKPVHITFNKDSVVIDMALV